MHISHNKGLHSKIQFQPDAITANRYNYKYVPVRTAANIRHV